MRIIISTILETLGKLDTSVKFIYYEEIPKWTPLTSTIEEKKVMIALLKFLNHLQYFFYILKKKPKGGRQFVKSHLLYLIPIKNIY